MRTKRSRKMPKSQSNPKSILKDFCDDSTFQACRFFTMENVPLFQRLLWATFNIALIIIMMYFILFLLKKYSENPTVVTLDNPNFPIQNVKYPGISICDTNKISRKRAYKLAGHLQKHTKKNMSTILEGVELLGSFYDLSVDPQKPFTMFQGMFDRYVKMTDEHDPTGHLLNLSSLCSEFLKECKWGGKRYPCEDLFLTRMTFEGFCCVFNYVRPYKRKSLYAHLNKREVPIVSEVPQGAGIENGLQVTMQKDPDDTFYTVMETLGFNVHVFHPNDFPDKLSGSLSEVLVNTNLEALISIDVDVIRSSPESRRLPKSMRMCKFEDDETTMFGSYRESDCYVTCRMESIKSLCGCVPFTIPSSFKTVCTLADIPCLNRYMEKWSRYYPHGIGSNILQREVQDSISCKQCVPPCNNVNYNVYTSFSAIDRSDQSRNITRVSIFFNKNFCNLYRVDTSSTWFEDISAFGGTLSLFMGISLISGVEIIILACKIITYVLMKRRTEYFFTH